MRRPKSGGMARFLLIASLSTAALLAGSPALAQFPNIFEQLFGPPPRPPADLPGRPMPPPGTQQRQQPGPPPGRLQQQSLPPPSGAVRPPQPGQQQPGPPPQQDANAPGGLPGVPPGQRQPRGTPQPANTAPQPGDEVIMEPPAQKIANPTAVFSGLDKITGRIINFEVAVNETVRFGALEVTPRVCYTRPPTSSPNTDGFIEVDELTLQGELRRIFTGWMFAASPGINAVEHPIYDVWLTDCKGATPAVTAEAPADPNPAAQQQQKPPPRPQQQQQQPPRRVAPQAVPQQPGQPGPSLLPPSAR
jgi:hypothetical protein